MLNKKAVAVVVDPI